MQRRPRYSRRYRGQDIGHVSPTFLGSSEGNRRTFECSSVSSLVTEPPRPSLSMISVCLNSLPPCSDNCSNSRTGSEEGLSGTSKEEFLTWPWTSHALIDYSLRGFERSSASENRLCLHQNRNPSVTWAQTQCHFVIAASVGGSLPCTRGLAPQRRTGGFYRRKTPLIRL